jgi:hypothetical protein
VCNPERDYASFISNHFPQAQESEEEEDEEDDEEGGREGGRSGNQP